MKLSPVEKSVPHEYSGTTAIVHAAFVATGMITVMLGPLLPTLAARWSLNDTQAGYLITAQFLGALLSTVSTGLLLPRLGYRRTIAAGLFLMAMGASTLLSGSFLRGLISVFIYGMGIGLTIPTGNLLVAEVRGERRSSALNLLNFSWSVGAVACPFFLAAFRVGRGLYFFLDSIAGFFVLLAMVVLASPSSMPYPSEKEPSANQQSWLQYFQNFPAIALGTLFFVYVGTENALGTWLASYAKRASAAPGSAWITVPSYFYGALLLGRAAAPFSLRRLSEAKQASMGVLLAFASCGALLLARSVEAIGVCAFLAGFGLSTLYPIAIGFLSPTFGPAASRAGGVMFALSTLGGASVPWLVGFASEQSGSLKTALVVPLAGCVMMFFLFSSPRLQKCVSTGFLRGVNA